MRKTITMALFLALGAGTIGAKALNLAGSDTLEQLTKNVIAACPGALVAPALVYVGGGSGAGETAIIKGYGAAGAQQIAPMSRFLAGSGTSATCSTPNQGETAEAIGIAGDDIGLWFSGDVTENIQAACDPGSATDTCQGYSAGGLAFKRTLPGSGVVLNSWKDVLRLLYFGLRPTDFDTPTAILGTSSATGTALAANDAFGDVNPQAIARRDCDDIARNELRNNFGLLFQNDCATSTRTATPACPRARPSRP